MRIRADGARGHQCSGCGQRTRQEAPAAHTCTFFNLHTSAYTQNLQHKKEGTRRGPLCDSDDLNLEAHTCSEEEPAGILEPDRLPERGAAGASHEVLVAYAVLIVEHVEHVHEDFRAHAHDGAFVLRTNVELPPRRVLQSADS